MIYFHVHSTPLNFFLSRFLTGSHLSHFFPQLHALDSPPVIPQLSGVVWARECTIYIYTPGGVKVAPTRFRGAALGQGGKWVLWISGLEGLSRLLLLRFFGEYGARASWLSRANVYIFILVVFVCAQPLLRLCADERLSRWSEQRTFSPPSFAV